MWPSCHHVHELGATQKWAIAYLSTGPVLCFRAWADLTSAPMTSRHQQILRTGWAENGPRPPDWQVYAAMIHHHGLAEGAVNGRTVASRASRASVKTTTRASVR